MAPGRVKTREPTHNRSNNTVPDAGKQRFKMIERDGCHYIRVSQGHSISHTASRRAVRNRSHGPTPLSVFPSEPHREVYAQPAPKAIRPLGTS